MIIVVAAVVAPVSDVAGEGGVDAVGVVDAVVSSLLILYSVQEDMFCSCRELFS